MDVQYILYTYLLTIRYVFFARTNWAIDTSLLVEFSP